MSTMFLLLVFIVFLIWDTLYDKLKFSHFWNINEILPEIVETVISLIFSLDNRDNRKIIKKLLFFSFFFFSLLIFWKFKQGNTIETNHIKFWANVLNQLNLSYTHVTANMII